MRIAIKKCHRGKAHGPDELGNDWYRTYVAELTPLLTRLFNWTKCLQSTAARLYLARLKTNSPRQRSVIAAAVIVPKILYIARHEWPSTATADQVIKKFVWGL